MTTVTLLPVNFVDVTSLGRDTTSITVLATGSVSTIYGFTDSSYETNNNSSLDEEVATTPATTFLHDFATTESKNLQVISLCILDLLCLIGNVILILTIYRCVELRTVTNCLILNLASIGILLSLIVLPSWILTTLTDLLVFGESACQVMGMIMLLLFLEAILTLGGVAFDRYGSICHPFSYPVLVNHWKALLFILVTWLTSVILSSMPLLGFGRYGFKISEVPLCTVNFGYQPAFSALPLILVVIPSCITIFVCYWKIFSVARSQARKVRNLESSLSQNLNIHENSNSNNPGPSAVNAQNGVARPPPMNPPPRPRNKLWQIVRKSVRNSVRETRAFRTVFTIIFCFLACWTPYIVLIIYAISSKYKPSFVLEFIFTYLALANYVANPVICITMNIEFRKGVKKVFRLHRKKLLEEVVSAWMSQAVALGQTRRKKRPFISKAISTVHPAGD